MSSSRLRRTLRAPRTIAWSSASMTRITSLSQRDRHPQPKATVRQRPGVDVTTTRGSPFAQPPQAVPGCGGHRARRAVVGDIQARFATLLGETYRARGGAAVPDYVRDPF